MPPPYGAPTYTNPLVSPNPFQPLFNSLGSSSMGNIVIPPYANYTGPDPGATGFTPPTDEQINARRQEGLQMDPNQRQGGFTAATADSFLSSQPLVPGGASRGAIESSLIARGVPDYAVQYFLGPGGFNPAGYNEANAGFLYNPVATPEQGGPPLTDFTNPSTYPGMADQAAFRAIAQEQGPGAGGGTESFGVVQLSDGSYRLPDGSIVGPEAANNPTMNQGGGFQLGQNSGQNGGGMSLGGGLVPPGQRTPTNVGSQFTGAAAGSNFDWDPAKGFDPAFTAGRKWFGTNNPSAGGVNPFVSKQGAPSLPMAQDVAAYLDQQIPGLAASIPPGFAGFDKDNRANIFNYLAGAFANDPAHLAGGAAGNILGAAMNQTGVMSANQQMANAASLSGLADAVGKLQTGPVLQGAHRLAGDLYNNPYTTSGDALQQDIEGIIRRRGNAAAEATRQGVADAGAAAGRFGGESALITSGADAAARSRMADALAQAQIDQALRRQGDIQASTAALTGLTDIYRDNLLAPQAMLSQGIANRFNDPFFNSYIDQTRQLGLLALEDERLDAAGKMGLQQTLMGGGMNLLGGVFGGLLGGAGHAQGFGNLFS